MALPDVEKVQILVTAERASAEPPSLKVGQHAKPQKTPLPIAGVKYIVPIGSGKGGVGKSTVSANIAVQFAKMGYLLLGFAECTIGAPFGLLKPGLRNILDGSIAPFKAMFSMFLVPFKTFGVIQV